MQSSNELKSVFESHCIWKMSTLSFVILNDIYDFFINVFFNNIFIKISIFMPKNVIQPQKYNVLLDENFLWNPEKRNIWSLKYNLRKILFFNS